jgi:hypothetical protein
MGTQRILCGICKARNLGTTTDPRFLDGDRVDPALICNVCEPAWRRFRRDVNEADAEAIALSQARLSLRGATVAELHAKIVATNEHEANRLSGLAVSVARIVADIDAEKVIDDIEPVERDARGELVVR